MAAVFVPGLELSARYYRDVVAPEIRVPHAAARIGTGSEVLGFDTERSTDHDWGARLQLFLTPEDTRKHAAATTSRLPERFGGHPTHVQIVDLGSWFRRQLGFDPREPIRPRHWLATPTQSLAETTADAVFHDDRGEVTAARAALAWYPDDGWRHVLAGQWQRIAEEEAFVGRCGEVGDELGSAVVAARIARDIMRLCLLMRRRYPPYSKWLGSAFAQLPDAATLTPALTAALTAAGWRGREAHLVTAYEHVATVHNELGLTDPVDPTTRDYHDRPFRVLHAERFAEALRTHDDWPPQADQYLDTADDGLLREAARR
ncbi:MAG: DUF4037 domain-containing protein [Actinophytocola sp.]|uniref:DUF4037 domain-containing protein n=1 Tax=Actinophytocola sp. TaxID=1872138 RepID=UPI00132A0BA9|nr:DUF4037 domain-containing protein [Actinophytocola sp.]MPZ85200.1 DUF4037 domain-containing protein [Actinophytocola sp.]